MLLSLKPLSVECKQMCLVVASLTAMVRSRGWGGFHVKDGQVDVRCRDEGLNPFEVRQALSCGKVHLLVAPFDVFDGCSPDGGSFGCGLIVLVALNDSN